MDYIKANFWDTFGKVVGDVIEKGSKFKEPVAKELGSVFSKGKNEVAEILKKGKDEFLGKSEVLNDVKDKKVSDKLNYYLKIKQLSDALQKLKLKLKDTEKYNDSLVALFAVAFSVANCDGKILPAEEEDIKGFLSGETFKLYPKEVKNKILRLKSNPPNFNTAMEYVKRLDKDNWQIIDDIIDITMQADGVIRKEESAYLKAWDIFKNENLQK